MFDANGVICTDIYKSSLELLSTEEILKTSVCAVTSTIVFDSEGPRKGGLHDPAMGSLDQRIPCATCGCRRDCPGHLGHIELPLPVFHPTLITTFVRLLKCLCFRCRRLKIDARTASVYIKRFQLIQYDMLSELEQFELIQGKIAKEQKRRFQDESTQDASAAKRVQLIKILTKLEEKRRSREGTEGNYLPTDISESHTSVETWATLRSAFFRAAMARPNCAYCGKTYKTTVKAGPLGNGIDITWPWGSEKPFSRTTWKSMTEDALKSQSKKDGSGMGNDGANSDLEDNEENKQHGKRGRIVGSESFQPYQIVNLIQALWKSPDKPLLEFLFPMSIKIGWEIFFLRYLLVSSNRFRPLMKGNSFGGGGGGGGGSEGTLHSRTTALLDILGVVEKMQFALGVLRNPDPLAALMDPEIAKDPYGVPLPNITEADKERLKKIITQHQGNFKLLATYSKELQEYVNTYIDSTKATKTRNSKAAPPGVRQWMEKKQGAIRQKMMGKRVNFAARTVIAPDNYINTNEIGIPVEFAKKLTIAEYVTPLSVAYLRQLVENGAKIFPGANMIQDSDGAVYDLSVMDQAQRQGKARLLLANITPGSAPKIVYRHVRDGDVVIMNRQPTLHRASMMCHFVRVLTGWKTFRMMYVNCGSYNADFDGDEMNMHLPQDPCARAEAQLIANADCHYITARDGGPLRGLIQDHVLGGNFLTCRNSFLNVNQYYTLLYVGMGVFIDRGQKVYLETGLSHGGKASNVARSAYSGKTTGDPYFRIMTMENLPIKVEPPTIYKPEKLWTGKQVITSILKTIIDAIARARFSDNPDFQKNYRGINFTSKAKTPGDAWGGVLDGDNEESTVIIRDSELLQGVFDKNQFGASSYGLVHLCFELFGPRAAGILLSIFAKTFTVFLQMRGFSCCTGDFLMTPQGERDRERMIMHCTIAGNYLQEIFVDAINKTMKWRDTLINTNSNRQKYKAAHDALTEIENEEEKKAKSCGGTPQLFNYLKQKSELTRCIDFDCYPTRQVTSSTSASSESDHHTDSPSCRMKSSEVSIKEIEIPSTFGLNYSLDAPMGLNKKQQNDVETWKSRSFEKTDKKDDRGSIEGSRNRTSLDDVEMTDAEYSKESLKKSKMKEQETQQLRSVTFDPFQIENSNLWEISRRLHSPMRFNDWRLKQPTEIIRQLKDLIESLQLIGSQNKRLQHAVLEALTKTPEIALYFPRVAQRLGIDRLWGPGLVERLNRSTFSIPPPAPPGRIAPPPPNEQITLPSGRMILGDGSLRTPQLFHPSWVYHDETGLPFEDTTRYITRMTEVKDSKDLEQYWLGLGSKPCHLRPNELTRLRLENLIRSHFSGKEDVLIRMADGFFQSNMGKLTSKNNDLVSGKATLYKFPFNGFSSMITTGAKGSKVNFAMICGMLSQQSLEGRRVPVMVSGKTLPSFARFDLGARAGGLITDRYLTGLRPQEYFFHCMAGREGLVDTAVKTARSGYLQRCVMKGMEGVMVSYDGTVRDSDGTIIQFLYGEDGVDVAKASYSKKLEDLLQNPIIARAKYWSPEKANHPSIKASMDQVKTFLKEQQILNDSIQDNPHLNEIDFNKYKHPLDPISNVYPPIGYVGSASEKYRTLVKEIVKADSHQFIPKTVDHLRNMRGIMIKEHKTEEEIEEAREILENLLLTKFSETLSVAGEGVGCLSAQSMGEPATQMTLNTFHLAGHGAANVTLGIPRLREILQTAGNAKTPMLYVPVRGDTATEAARNAEQVLLGFKRIPLTDVIHAVGIESNVYHQPQNVLRGLPEYELSLYKDNIDQNLVPKFFWEYEITIQFENLDHFCKVVPKFSPGKILALTMSRVVRDMMKQVNKLMFLYATKYAEEEIDSEDDELEDAVERYVFDRHTRSHFQRRDQRKERAKNAGVGFGTNRSSELTGEMDLLTAVDVAETYKRKTKIDDDEGGGGNEREDKEDEDDKERDDNSDALPDSEHSKDDSEEDFSESDMGDDAKKVEHESDDENVPPAEKIDEEELMSEQERKEWEARNEEREKKQAERRRLRALKSKYKGINLEFDRLLRVLRTDKLIEAEGEELEEGAMWSDTEVAQWKIRPLPEEAFRFLTDVKVCRKTWRIVLKFGWPLERCPRRITFLQALVKIIKKHVLQETPGVRNPRIVGGDNSETGSMYEIQCEGSNFGWIQRLKDQCVDHNRVTTNDIRAVLQFFGVEACRLVIIRELNKVFSVYGITVDYRHMSLIADAMTHSGFFRSFSRLGIAHHSSPFLQMSFETSMKFLTEAVERGAHDDLRTPAGSIVTGKPALVGSGMCRILPRIQLGTQRSSLRGKPNKHELLLKSIKEEINEDQDTQLKTIIKTEVPEQPATFHENGAEGDDEGSRPYEDKELKRKRNLTCETNSKKRKKQKFQFS